MLNADKRVSPSPGTGKAMIAQAAWTVSEYRPEHDLVVPPVIGPPGGETWMDSPYMLPARRKYLLSFQGSTSSKSEFDSGSFNAYQS